MNVQVIGGQGPAGRPSKLVSVPSSQLVGVDGRPVRVEVHIADGLPSFTVVGLADAGSRELRDRVRAALMSCDLKWPARRVTVNVAPPTGRRMGTGLDLPVALALLAADGQLDPAALRGGGALGELGLDGKLRPVPGTLSRVDALDVDEVIVPRSMATEAAMVNGPTVRAVEHLSSLVRILRGDATWPAPPAPAPVTDEAAGTGTADIHGPPAARQALNIAAAGGHHLLLVGPFGSGKTTLARRLGDLLPDLSTEDAFEVTRVHSAAGLPLPGGFLRRPPFRHPPHTASAVSFVGGHTPGMQPGELSLAYRGVLFLDDLPEFSPALLENLRQPLEEGVIRVRRAVDKVTFPARVQLVGAMRPCPCGQSATSDECRCSPVARTRYSRRLSVPLLDRFDLRVELDQPSPVELASVGEPGRVAAARVAAARQRAATRGIRANAELSADRLDEEAPLTSLAARLVDRARREGRLTGRSLNALRRVALTVADLADDEPPLDADHVATALALRSDLSYVTGRTT